MNTIKQIAKQNGTTTAEVKREMENAIEMGFSNPDPHIRAMWRHLFPDGKKPAPEQFIKAVAWKLKTC